jgi:hypothetical protein
MSVRFLTLMPAIEQTATYTGVTGINPNKICYLLMIGADFFHH